MAQLPIRECPLSFSHMATSAKLSLSLPISLSSLPPSPIGQASHLRLTALPLSNYNTRQTSRKGVCRWSDAWSPSSRWWTVGPMQLFESSACNSVFGCFWRRPATFHGEATYFRTSSPSSTKSCPPWPINLHRSKAGYYLHRDFHGFFRWTGEVSWDGTF